MSYFDAIILGILQGLTEFLPVSSSGHLVLAQAVLGVKQPGVAFEVLVHLGTLLAVIVYFRRSIAGLARSLFDSGMKKERMLAGCLVVGTVPAALVGLLFKNILAETFSNPVLTSVMLSATGLILLSTRYTSAGKENVTPSSAIIIGLGQAVALLPGISRSGTSIAAGMAMGVKPSEAAEFSFLLAIPAIAGAAVLESGQLLNLDPVLAGQYLAGALAAFLLAFPAVYLVLTTIRRGRFQYFAYYCFAVAAVGLYLFL